LWRKATKNRKLTSALPPHLDSYHLPPTHQNTALPHTRTHKQKAPNQRPSIHSAPLTHRKPTARAARATSRREKQAPVSPYLTSAQNKPVRVGFKIRSQIRRKRGSVDDLHPKVDLFGAKKMCFDLLPTLGHFRDETKGLSLEDLDLSEYLRVIA